MRLETDRLVLRPLTLDDADALAPIYADPEVMRYLGSGETVTNRDEVDVYVRRMVERYEADGFGALGVVRKDDGRLLGRVGFLVWDTVAWRPTTRAEADGPTEVEIGWKLGREFWGHGYATEAALAVRDYGFAELGYTRLISLIHPANAASIRVAEKLGERLEREVVTAGGQRALLYAVGR